MIRDSDQTVEIEGTSAEFFDVFLKTKADTKILKKILKGLISNRRYVTADEGEEKIINSLTRRGGLKKGVRGVYFIHPNYQQMFNSIFP